LTKDQFSFDVFLSYSGADVSIVRSVAESMRKGALRVWFDEWVVRSGDVVEYKVGVGLEQSRVLLFFASDNSLGDEWGRFEERTLRFRDPGNQDRRFIPLRLDNVSLPATLHQVECIDWRTEDSEAIVAKLVAVCKPPPQRPTSRGLDVPRFAAKKRQRSEASSHIRCAVFDIKRRRTVLGTSKGEICFIDADKSAATLPKISAHSASVSSLDLEESKLLLLSGSLDRTVKLWDLKSNECVRTFSGTEPTTAVKFAGDAIVASSLGDDIWVWETAEAVSPRVLRGHSGAVHALEVSGDVIMSASSDRTIRLWSMRTGQCTRVLEGHLGAVHSLALSLDGNHLLSGSDDRTVRLWDVNLGVCLNTFDAHTDTIRTLAWDATGRAFVSGGGDRGLRLWNTETGKLLAILDGHEIDVLKVSFEQDQVLSCDAQEILQWGLKPSLIPARTSLSNAIPDTAGMQVQYTNAKVLLIGDSGAGKTGLSKRLASDEWEPSAASTVGAWATQWSLPASAGENGDREIWLWDFGGQADQRLIHQLYMDETALAVLVFDAQKTKIFESLAQWNRDLTRSKEDHLAKLLVAGRIDASPIRVSRQDINEYVQDNNFSGYFETSALTNHGCSELRDAIVSNIDWNAIPWRSSPVLFKRLKQEIVRLKDEGRILMRFNELRDALKIRLPAQEINFTDAELKAVLSLLSGPGVLLELEFGAWILFHPELINAYGQAVIATMRDDPSELGCVSEQRVLDGDLEYGGFKRIAPDDERFVLLAMHRKFLQRGLCARELTEKDVQLVFPSYYKRNRPELVGHPAVLVSYRFDGVVDEVYSTLVVRLNHTHTFKRDKLWQDAAEFTTTGGMKIGVKLTRAVADRAAAIEVYCDPNALLGDKIVFVKYVHDHLLHRASNVIRRRHYVCKCSNPIADLDAAEKRRLNGKVDIGCPLCDARVRLIDDLEEQYSSAEYQRRVRRLEDRADEELDNESKERALVGDVISLVALAGQISREKNVSDHGIDMEIEFKNDKREATGQMLYLQLKSGDSYLKTRANGKHVFSIKKERHADYWADAIAPVMLVVRTSNGDSLDGNQGSYPGKACQRAKSHANRVRR
jgi:small GTP-binding protein